MGKRGPKPMEPTDDQRQQVEMMAAVGVPQAAMGQILGISVDTLAKYFRKELDLGLHKANAKIAGRLFNKAMAGDTTSIIFWLKTRAGFKETSGIDLNGAMKLDTVVDTTRLNDEQLRALASIPLVGRGSSEEGTGETPPDRVH